MSYGAPDPYSAPYPYNAPALDDASYSLYRTPAPRFGSKQGPRESTMKFEARKADEERLKVAQASYHTALYCVENNVELPEYEDYVEAKIWKEKQKIEEQDQVEKEQMQAILEKQEQGFREEEREREAYQERAALSREMQDLQLQGGKQKGERRGGERGRDGNRGRERQRKGDKEMDRGDRERKGRKTEAEGPRSRSRSRNPSRKPGGRKAPRQPSDPYSKQSSSRAYTEQQQPHQAYEERRQAQPAYTEQREQQCRERCDGGLTVYRHVGKLVIEELDKGDRYYLLVGRAAKMGLDLLDHKIGFKALVSVARRTTKSWKKQEWRYALQHSKQHRSIHKWADEFLDRLKRESGSIRIATDYPNTSWFEPCDWYANETEGLYGVDEWNPWGTGEIFVNGVVGPRSKPTHPSPVISHYTRRVS